MVADEVAVERVQLADDKYVLVQIEPLGGEELVASQRPKLEDLLDEVLAVSERVVSTLGETRGRKLTVEFGVSFALESGQLLAMITKGSLGANLKVTMEFGAAGE